MRVFKMCQIRSTTEATTTSNDKPLPTPKDDMRAKLQGLLKGAVDKAQSTNAKSLVERATAGTPDEKKFS